MELMCHLKQFLKSSDYFDLPKKDEALFSNVWHLFPIKINFKKLKKSRGAVMVELASNGIGTQVHYIPLYLQPYYKQRNIKQYSGASKYYDSTLSLPLYTQLKKEDISFISKKIKDILK